MDIKINFPKNAKCCGNFDSNIGAQRFVSTEKFTFEIDDLRKSRRTKKAPLYWHVGTSGDIITLVNGHHEY